MTVPDPGSAPGAEAAEAPLARRIFRALADGALHSGEQLAAAEQVSRSAVWKTIGQLQELGLDIEAVAHRGYRLAAPLVPLEAARVMESMASATRARVHRLEVAWSLDSTNSALLARGERGAGARSAPPPGQFDLLLAEHQSAGRGRRARAWLAPPGGALCLSLGWSFATLPTGVAALSLAIGVCVRRALARLVPQPILLKWPNDLQVEGRKLAGILIELRAEASGPAYAVIGVGVNCALGAAVEQRVRASGTAPIDLAALGVAPCDRNRLAAALADEMAAGLLEFKRAGFARFGDEWSAADALAGREVRVHAPEGEVAGRASGVAADGTLRVDCGGEMRHFHSGEVSVRTST